MTDDDRILYLTGERSGSLDPDEVAALDELHQLLADPALWAEPDSTLEDRIVEAIPASPPGPDPQAAEPQAAEPQAAQPQAAEPQAAEPPLRPEITAIGPPARQQRRRRVVMAVAGLAAAAVIVVAVAVALAGRGFHPVTYQAALAGTPLAPDASGRASMTQTVSGWRITLHATGLPRLDDGSFYEGWLKNPAGILVSIGTFNQPRDVILWAGVAPYDYPTMSVTRQVANGNPASSGQRVLIGTAKRA